MNEKEFDALYRACLKGLFSLIEADIYGLSKLDPYESYSDGNDFKSKFKRAFKYVCKIRNKTEIQKKYFDSKYRELKDLRNKRDELTHPKEIEHIHKANELEFKKVKRVFNDYKDFIDNLMDGYSNSVDLKFTEVFKERFKNTK